jgi:hypothetical protein
LTWALPAWGDYLIIFHNRRNPSVWMFLRAVFQTPNLTKMAKDCKEQSQIRKSHKHVCLYEDCCMLSQFIWCHLLHDFVVVISICPKKDSSLLSLCLVFAGQCKNPSPRCHNWVYAPPWKRGLLRHFFRYGCELCGCVGIILHQTEVDIFSQMV